MRCRPYSFRGSRPRPKRKRWSPRIQKVHTTSSAQPAKSHNFAAGKKELATPMANVLSRRKRPMRTRVREIGSGCLGSNGGPEPNGGCAMMSVSNGVFCVFSDFRIASNEKEVSYRHRGRAVLEVNRF